MPYFLQGKDMKRIPEPELMNRPEQAHAYAMADFSWPNELFMQLFNDSFPKAEPGRILDLGCGPGDITIAFARKFPQAEIIGVDGAQNMLAYGCKNIKETEIEARVSFVEAHIPGLQLEGKFDTIISNSLLHHLQNPLSLWETVKIYGKAGAGVLIMDLLRPANTEQAKDFVQRYAEKEPPILQEDFFNSLLAAYTVSEVRAQIATVGLNGFTVRQVFDRHWAAHGTL